MKNKRFVEKRLTSLDEDLVILKQNTAENEVPFAAVQSCADSRVPVELVFDQSIGPGFVKYPPRQKAASFNLDSVLRHLSRPPRDWMAPNVEKVI